MPHTRACAALAPIEVISPFQSKEEGNEDESDDGLSLLESGSIEASQTQPGRADSQPPEDPTPTVTSTGARNIRQCVPGMKEIYDKGLELKGQGKPIRQFHEESRLNESRLSRVPELETGINRHRLGWLS